MLGRISEAYFCVFVHWGGKADERIDSAALYFTKAIAICLAVGMRPFAYHHSYWLCVSRLFLLIHSHMLRRPMLDWCCRTVKFRNNNL